MEIISKIEEQESRIEALRESLPEVMKIHLGIFDVSHQTISVQTEDGTTKSINLKELPKDWFATIDHKGNWLGRVGDLYSVLQPRLLFDQLVATMQMYSDDGFKPELFEYKTWETGGRYQMRYPIGKFKVGDRDDEVQVIFFVESSNDGSRRTTAGIFHLRFECSNGMRVVEGEELCASHTYNSNIKVKAFTGSMDKLMTKERELQELFTTASRYQISDEDKAKFACHVLNQNYAELQEGKLHTRTANRVNDLLSDIETELSYSPTLWGLVNGASRYATHTQPSKNDDGQSLNFGAGRTVNNRALAYMTQQLS